MVKGGSWAVDDAALTALAVAVVDFVVVALNRSILKGDAILCVVWVARGVGVQRVSDKEGLLFKADVVMIADFALNARDVEMHAAMESYSCPWRNWVA